MIHKPKKNGAYFFLTATQSEFGIAPFFDMNYIRVQMITKLISHDPILAQKCVMKETEIAWEEQ